MRDYHSRYLGASPEGCRLTQLGQARVRNDAIVEGRADPPNGKGVTRAETVYQTIRRRIIELELMPGAVLTEGQLAAEFGVSKTPVREALGRLQSDGLVVLGRGSYSVSAVTFQDVHEFLALRALLEIEAVRLAAARAQQGLMPTSIATDLARLSRMTYEPTKHQDVIRFLGIDQDFHLLVGQASGNTRLAETLGNVLAQCQRVTQLGTAHSRGASSLQHDHAELVDAILAGRSEDAVRIANDAARNRERNISEAMLRHPSIQATKLHPDIGNGTGR
jgi:DNA-binding GntR family transcriptional regulator